MVRQGLAALLHAESDITLLAQAADGEFAWTLITDHAPQVAILDLELPKAGGIEIARRVEAAALETRVLLLALHDTPTAALSAQQAGAVGYVLKDRPFEELILAVRTVAAGQTFITRSVRAKLRTLQRNGGSTAPLSAREREVVCLMAQGKSSKEIARILTISTGTVDTHRKRLMKKLRLHSAAEVVRWGVQVGVVV